ncbi:MAG: alpha/beta hydrolase [Rhodospirillaceae bacterium]|nr:alpha/beta hydrolase [Rhodospirillaceae bacterium]
MIRNSIDIDEEGGRRRLSWVEWGEPEAERTVVCVHGLTRNARDFDRLAEVLSGQFRVICPDVAGRGESDRLVDPARYGVPTYVGDILTMLDRLRVGPVDWVGTSMGGLIGMAIAGVEAEVMRGRIDKMVLNDVGPFIPKAALERIGQYVGLEWRFKDMAEAERHFRAAYAPFGPLSDDEWRHLTWYGVREDDDGDLVPAYDPAIAVPFRSEEIADIALWPLWEAIACPVLVLRGAESDLLTEDVLEEMIRRRPSTRAVTFSGVGHAPALMANDQIEVIREWLTTEV